MLAAIAITRFIISSPFHCFQMIHVEKSNLFLLLSLFTCVVVVVQENADNFCVYRNEIHHSVGERTQVLQDVAADPTLPRTKAVRCVQCNHGEAVFFQVNCCTMELKLAAIAALSVS